MEEQDSKVIVVAASDYSFEKVQEKKIWAEPSNYNRGGDCDYIAFYRSRPESAITHYAKIESIEERDDVLSEWEIGMMMPNYEGTPRVYELSNLEKLEQPVEKDPNYIQRHKYTTLKALKNAEGISEIGGNLS